MSETLKGETEMYVAFGKALATWAYVEWLHSELFGLIASGQAQNKPLQRAYWAIVSFDAKHKMVDAALREALSKHPSYLARWNNLSNRLHTKSKLRNRLAHAQLAEFHNEGVPNSLAMVTSIYASTKVGDDKKILLGNIQQMDESFDRLGEDLLDFQKTYFTEQMTDTGRSIPRYVYPTEQPGSRGSADG